MQIILRHTYSYYENYFSHPNIFSENYHRIVSTFYEVTSMVSSGYRKHFGNVQTFDYCGANPEQLSDSDCNRPAIILLHGSQHNQSGWMPLLKKFQERKIGPVYTLNYTQDKRQEQLRATLETVKGQYRKHGKNPNVILIGHSLGGIVAAEYFFGENHVSDVTVQKVITIGSRLKITENAPFPAMFSDIVPIVNQVYENILKSVEKEKLFTISAKRDWLVPMAASQVYQNGASVLPESQRFVVDDCSHLSVLYSPETEEKILQLV